MIHRKIIWNEKSRKKKSRTDVYTELQNMLDKINSLKAEHELLKEGHNLVSEELKNMNKEYLELCERIEKLKDEIFDLKAEKESFEFPEAAWSAGDYEKYLMKLETEVEWYRKIMKQEKNWAYDDGGRPLWC